MNMVESTLDGVRDLEWRQNLIGIWVSSKINFHIISLRYCHKDYGPEMTVLIII